MCTSVNDFKLCSCGSKLKRPWLRPLLRKTPIAARIHPDDDEAIRELPDNKWCLYMRDNHQSLIGDFVIDDKYWEEEKKKNKTYGFIVEALNTRNDCFDFQYRPKDGDLLRIKLAGGQIVDIVFENLGWRMNDQSSAFEQYDHWLINSGDVKQV